MSGLALTERQYEELRTYEHGLPSWREGRADDVARRLLAKRFLRYVGDGFYQITDGGREALAEFRTKHGLPVGV